MSVGKSGLRCAVSWSIRKLGYGGKFKFKVWGTRSFSGKCLHSTEISINPVFLLQMTLKWPNESWHTLRRAPFSYPESLGLIGQVQVLQRPFNKLQAATVHPVFKYSIIFGILHAWAIKGTWHILSTQDAHIGAFPILEELHGMELVIICFSLRYNLFPDTSDCSKLDSSSSWMISCFQYRKRSVEVSFIVGLSGGKRLSSFFILTCSLSGYS